MKKVNSFTLENWTYILRIFCNFSNRFIILQKKLTRSHCGIQSIETTLSLRNPVSMSDTRFSYELRCSTLMAANCNSRCNICFCFIDHACYSISSLLNWNTLIFRLNLASSPEQMRWIAKLWTTPRELRGCKCHRIPKLHIVTRIIVPTNQVYLCYHESNSHLHLFHDQKIEKMKWKQRRGHHTTPSERPESLQPIRWSAGSFPDRWLL